MPLILTLVRNQCISISCLLMAGELRNAVSSLPSYIETARNLSFLAEPLTEMMAALLREARSVSLCLMTGVPTYFEVTLILRNSTRPSAVPPSITIPAFCVPGNHALLLLSNLVLPLKVCHLSESILFAQPE